MTGRYTNPRLPLPLPLSLLSMELTSISNLFAAADQSLFKRILTNELHVLQPLLPDKTNFSYNLRSWRHNRQWKTTHVNNSNLIIRMLYSDSY